MAAGRRSCSLAMLGLRLLPAWKTPQPLPTAAPMSLPAGTAAAPASPLSSPRSSWRTAVLTGSWWRPAGLTWPLPGGRSRSRWRASHGGALPAPLLRCCCVVGCLQRCVACCAAMPAALLCPALPAGLPAGLPAACCLLRCYAASLPVLFLTDQGVQERWLVHTCAMRCAHVRTVTVTVIFRCLQAGAGGGAGGAGSARGWQPDVQPAGGLVIPAWLWCLLPAGQPGRHCRSRLASTSGLRLRLHLSSLCLASAAGPSAGGRSRVSGGTAARPAGAHPRKLSVRALAAAA